MITTKIQVDKHIAEYAIGKWGKEFAEPVRFPVNSELYVTIYDLTQRRPKGIYHDNGNIEIALPSRRECEEMEVRKNPDIYNYISERSSNIINKKITLHFWAELHELLDHEKHANGIEYIETVHYFFCKYKIESITEECIIKNYYRWREKLRQKNKRNYKKK